MSVSFCLPYPVAVLLMNLMIVPGMFVCSSFLISVCMFLCRKLCSYRVLQCLFAQGDLFFATVLFSVCSAVTAECCVLYPCCMGVFSMFAVM